MPLESSWSGGVDDLQVVSQHVQHLRDVPVLLHADFDLLALLLLVVVASTAVSYAVALVDLVQLQERDGDAVVAAELVHSYSQRHAGQGTEGQLAADGLHLRVG